MDRRAAIASGAALALAAAAPARAATLTVADVLTRMQGQIGTPWKDGGVDRIIFGDPGTPVRGIATTMMATFDALKGAAAAGANFIITHEPTWWAHLDDLAGLDNDPLYRTKRAYAQAHGLVLFRLHDHWHAKLPVDGINFGMARKLGWNGYRDAADQHVYNLPPTTLAALAGGFKRILRDRTLRVVGDPALLVSTVRTGWGYAGAPGAGFMDKADVLVIGEAQDWDVIAYAQDLAASGRKKALVVLGHVASEQWGMEYCAEWLRGFVPETKVSFVPVIEPYWNLRAPAFEINTKP